MGKLFRFLFTLAIIFCVVAHSSVNDGFADEDSEIEDMAKEAQKALFKKKLGDMIGGKKGKMISGSPLGIAIKLMAPTRLGNGTIYDENGDLRKGVNIQQEPIMSPLNESFLDKYNWDIPTEVGPQNMSPFIPNGAGGGGSSRGGGVWERLFGPGEPIDIQNHVQ